MIRRRWREPNFRCRATDPDGHERSWITYGASEHDVRARLEADGWTVHDVRPYDFALWRRRAAEALVATAMADADDGESSFSDGVWGGLKRHLFELFDGKCAYCETRVLDVDQPGQVEHYRPRRAVAEDPAHPGYWWLAYDVANLLPSCGLCNGASNKGTKFPLGRGGVRAMAPGPLTDERPLLLNPWDDDPHEHLVFLKTGDVEGRTPRGTGTIEICGLHHLRNQRVAALERLENDMRVAAFRHGIAVSQACAEHAQAVIAGKTSYAAAQQQHLLRMIEGERQQAADAAEALRRRLATEEG